jgi:signal transduction histidine kinase
LKLIKDGELGDLSPAQNKAVASMNDCVQRLRRLIDNLLDVTGLETGRMHFAFHEYDLGDLVHQALEKTTSSSTGRLRVVTEVPDQPLPGQGDAARLQRAVEHLIDNALKFTPEGGTIGVRARVSGSAQFEIGVIDSGPGIPDDALERLFDPFYQVDGSPTRAHGGTGVGLAIVRGVARGHGGDVRVVPASDERIEGVHLTGAGFYLVLPTHPSG